MKTIAPGTRCPHKLRVWHDYSYGSEIIYGSYLVRCKLVGPHKTHKNGSNTW